MDRLTYGRDDSWHKQQFAYIRRLSKILKIGKEGDKNIGLMSQPKRIQNFLHEMTCVILLLMKEFNIFIYCLYQVLKII